MPLNTTFAPLQSSRFDVYPKLCIKFNKAFLIVLLSVYTSEASRLPEVFSVN